MQRLLVNPKFFKTSLITLLVGGLLYAGSEPAHSVVVSTITLNGQAAGLLALDGSGAGATDCTATGGTGAGASWTVVPTDLAANANGTFNFGTLSSGDGTLLTAQLGLRVRANSPCHITAVCNQAASVIPAAPNLVYQGTNLTTAATLAASIGIANTVAALSGGARANVGAYSSAGSIFTGANTLATLTNAAAPLTASTLFCSFTAAPSTGGTLVSNDNYVQVYPLFTTNTGLAWGTSTGAASTPFTQSVVFGLFAN